LNNAIVGQSGGPTAVINASLAGVYEACINRGINNVYGMTNGIKGLLEGSITLLNSQLSTSLEIELLKRTPSSYLGSCRYKLPHFNEDESPYEEIFRFLNSKKINFFYYIGGNDSMDTIMKLSDYANKINSNIKFVGIPKTIDNDLMVTDHTPGFGSAAKYIAVTMKEIIRDATVYGSPYVTIVEIMGRNAGWLTASASLAHSEDCEGVDMICLPEIPFSMENFLKKVEKSQKEKPSTIIAVSEGLKLSDGRYVCDLTNDARFVDSFGHKNLTGTARLLTNYVASNLGVKVRPIELSTLQRCAGHLTSRTDITEAYQVGGAAVKASFEGQSGVMIAIKRISNDPYQSTTEPHDIHEVANFEKKIPIEWINESHTNVLPPYHQYVRPLIQAELTPIFINGLTRHIKL
jgi:6-phosphofructokinase 1